MASACQKRLARFRRFPSLTSQCKLDDMRIIQLIRSPGVIAAIVGVVGLGIGSLLSYVYVQRDVTVLESRLAEQEEQVSNLDARLNERQTRIDDLLARLGDETTVSSLLPGEEGAIVGELSQTQRTLTKLQKRMDSITETVADLENDRLLLIELRKDLPQDREAALQFWQAIKTVAVHSDPALGPLVDRILSAALNYFDWQEATYLSSEARLEGFFVSGAAQFENLVDEFKKDVLLLVIGRIDTVVNLAS